MAGRGAGKNWTLTDVQKAERGNKDKRFTEQARAEKKIVNLFAHPRLDTIPKPDIPMGEVGSSRYRELAEMLLKSGQLTIITKGYAESAAVALEVMAEIRGKRKPVPASLFTQYNRALANIQQFDIDRQVNAPGQRENRFARSGFASRLHKPKTS